MSVEVKVGFWWTRSGRLAVVMAETRPRDYPWYGITAGHRGIKTWADDGCIIVDSAKRIDDLVEYIGTTHPGVDTRPKPEPKWVPWSFDDDLLGVEIKLKYYEWRGAIVEQGIKFAYTATKQISYVNLFENYEQLDGTPCGKQVTE